MRAVGDFVPSGAVLVEIHGDVEDVRRAENELRGMIALGEERTIQQDPAFAIRIMVDIAIRALAPAVNDPTTAVQVLSYVGEILRLIGSTDLSRRRPDVDDGAALVSHARARLGRLPGARAHGDTGVRGSELDPGRAAAARSPRRAPRERSSSEHRPALEGELARLDATVAASWGASRRPRSGARGGRPGGRWGLSSSAVFPRRGARDISSSVGVRDQLLPPAQPKATATSAIARPTLHAVVMSCWPAE